GAAPRRRPAAAAARAALTPPPPALPDAPRAAPTDLGRRPVILALPLNVQGVACEPGPVPPQRQAYPTAPAAEAVTALAEVLRGARRPVFLPGRGGPGRAAEPGTPAAGGGGPLGPPPGAQRAVRPGPRDPGAG